MSVVLLIISGQRRGLCLCRGMLLDATLPALEIHRLSAKHATTLQGFLLPIQPQRSLPISLQGQSILLTPHLPKRTTGETLTIRNEMAEGMPHLRALGHHFIHALDKQVCCPPHKAQARDGGCLLCFSLFLDSRSTVFPPTTHSAV